MKNFEYFYKYGQVVAELDFIFEFKFLNPIQLDLDLEDQINNPRKPRHVSTMLKSQIKDQYSFFNLVEPLLNIISESLSARYEQFLFDTGISNYLYFEYGSNVPQILAASRNGKTISRDSIKRIQNSIKELVTEANFLIEKINLTANKSIITSIILCPESEKHHRTNPIVYKDRSAAEFAYKYFNSKNALRKSPLCILVGEEKLSIKPAITRTDLIEYSQREHIVAGNIQFESTSKYIYRITGNYVDDSLDTQLDPTTTSFNRTASISKDSLFSDQVKKKLSNIDSKKIVVSKLWPAQPYVNITKVSTNKLRLVNIES